MDNREYAGFWTRTGLMGRADQPHTPTSRHCLILDLQISHARKNGSEEG